MFYKHAFMNYLKHKIFKYVFKEFKNHRSLACSGLTTSSKVLAPVMEIFPEPIKCTLVIQKEDNYMSKFILHLRKKARLY